uniref:Neuropeptide-like 4 n=1 Tax=Steinernema glaseri TaxID=37863 RepID=A0A1I7Y2M9_9BILA
MKLLLALFCAFLAVINAFPYGPSYHYPGAYYGHPAHYDYYGYGAGYYGPRGFPRYAYGPARYGYHQSQPYSPVRLG